MGGRYRREVAAYPLSRTVRHRRCAPSTAQLHQDTVFKGVDNLMVNQQQADKMTTGKGFIAALDQSGGSTPKALRLYGVEESAYSSEEEMFDLIHQMRSRIITSPVKLGNFMPSSASATLAGSVDLAASMAFTSISMAL